MQKNNNRKTSKTPHSPKHPFSQHKYRPGTAQASSKDSVSQLEPHESSIDSKPILYETYNSQGKQKTEKLKQDLNKNAKNRQKDNKIKEYNNHDSSSANNEGNS